MKDELLTNRMIYWITAGRATVGDSLAGGRSDAYYKHAY
jgi:hypothetical protein